MGLGKGTGPALLLCLRWLLALALSVYIAAISICVQPGSFMENLTFLAASCTASFELVAAFCFAGRSFLSFSKCILCSGGDSLGVSRSFFVEYDKN